MKAFPKVADKFASIGTLIAAMGCAGCFPALGSLAAALGLGFLSSYERLFITALLPGLAGLALCINIYYWWWHRIHWRGVLSITGPTVVLISLYPIWYVEWNSYLFYAGVILMLTMSTLDFVKPPGRSTCPI